MSKNIWTKKEQRILATGVRLGLNLAKESHQLNRQLAMNQYKIEFFTRLEKNKPGALGQSQIRSAIRKER